MLKHLTKYQTKPSVGSIQVSDKLDPIYKSILEKQNQCLEMGESVLQLFAQDDELLHLATRNLQQLVCQMRKMK